MKNKTTAGLLALILGGLGVHRFYLGQTKWGILYLLFCWTYIPMVLSLIDAFLFFSNNTDAFDRKYNPKSFEPEPDYTPQYIAPTPPPLIETKPIPSPTVFKPVVSAVLPLLDVSFVAIDFETANRRRGSACSIGMSKVVNGRVVDSYVKYLRPEPFEFDSHNVAVHGITERQTRDAVTIEDDWLNIRNFVDGLPLVAHNASFDISVLEQSLEACGGMVSGWKISCTLKRAKELLPNRTSYKLPDLCKEFGIPLIHHDAGSDAEACARLHLHLLGLNNVVNYTPPTVTVKKEKRAPVRRKQLITAASEYFDETTLEGNLIVFTGDLDEMSREEAIEAAEAKGAIIRTAVSGKTNFLVVGNQTQTKYDKSSKELKAEELIAAGHNIVILNEDEFLELLN